MNERLLVAIKEKIPQRSKLVDVLADILFLEKESVYRRLRHEVPFTFAETAIISKELGISLDNIIRENGLTMRPFQLDSIEYTDLFDIDYGLVEQHVDFFGQSRTSSFSETAEACNVLPISLYARSELLSRFYLFKWLYQVSPIGSICLRDIKINERLARIYQSFFDESKYMNDTTYIWDHSIFQYLVNDLQFFRSIQLITGEEIALFKEELSGFLDYTENIAIDGRFEETGKSVRCYILDINLEACYSYAVINNQYISYIRAFILNSVLSTDQYAFDWVKSWIECLKRSSTLVSGSGEKHRVSFFNRQRKIIDSL